MRRDAPALGALCALIAVAAVLSLTACGGGSDSSSGAEAGETAGGASTTGEAASPPSAEEEVEAAGREAEGSEAEAIVSAQHEYLMAIADEDYAKACSLLSEGALKSLQASITKPAGSVECPEILAKILGSAAASAARDQAAGEVRKVRVLGNEALVIFHAPGAKLYVFGLVDEDSEWRAATLTSTVLAPSAATLNGAE